MGMLWEKNKCLTVSSQCHGQRLMQVILILENPWRQNLFAFYKYFLARRETSHHQNITIKYMIYIYIYVHSHLKPRVIMFHRLFSWISYGSIFLGVLNEFIFHGPNPNLHRRKVSEPLGGCKHSSERWGPMFNHASTYLEFVLLLSYLLVRICSVMWKVCTIRVHLYDIHPHWPY